MKVLETAPEEQEFVLLCTQPYYGIACNATGGLDFIQKLVKTFYFALDCDKKE